MKAKVYASIRVDTLDTNPVSDLDAGCSRLNTTFSTEKAVSTRRLILLTNRRNSTGQGVRLSVRGTAHSCTPVTPVPPVIVSSVGIRPSPTPTRAPIIWISNLTLYKEIPVGVNEVWIDVEPGSPVDHVDIYIDGYPAGYATGPGYRVNPKWTPTPTPPGTQPPTATLAPEAAATATQVRATVEVRETKSARAAATGTARSRSVATSKALSAEKTAQSVNATASVLAQTATSTPPPPTDTPLPSPTPTFVIHEPLLDPMLGDYVARCQFKSGRHRVVAIGYTKDNREVARNETWVIVK